MRKLSLFLATFISVIVALSTTSCLKEKTFSNENVVNKFDFTIHLKVINGTIVFKDLQSFKEVINELNTDKTISLNNWTKYIGFENSMYLAEKDTNYIAPTTIEDPVFCSIVNKEGVFAIGKEIHKLSGDTEYIISDGNYETVNKIEKETLTI